ncbi:MAG: anthranilate phosphoribosyltransferase [Terriglobia bacterium]
MEAAQRNQPAPFPDVLRRLLEGATFDRAQARAVMETVLCGEATDAQIASLLTVLRVRGETTDELVGFAEAMRAHARPIFSPDGRPQGALVDTCGTGGDGAGTFNVSTAAAFVVAGAGVRVAKHGNRSLSSRCGSADVLEALGVNLLAEPARIAAAICEVGIGFIFAPAVHTAMKHAQKARRDLRFRTVFNLLGPLTNPAGVDAQVVGVFDAHWLEPVARALGELGVRRAFVLHSQDGLDEASLSAPTAVAELHQGTVRQYEITPEQFGLTHAPREALLGGEPVTNARIIEAVFHGLPGPQRDVVVMNAALGLLAADADADFKEAAARARQAIDSGAARQRLRALAEFSASPSP